SRFVRFALLFNLFRWASYPHGSQLFVWTQEEPVDRATTSQYQSCQFTVNLFSAVASKSQSIGHVRRIVILTFLMALYLPFAAAVTRVVNFQSHSEYATGADTAAAATADLNRDGIVDLVTANLVDNSVSVLLGKGDGTFPTRVDFKTGSEPFWVGVW